MTRPMIFRAKRSKVVLRIAGASIFVWVGFQIVGNRPLLGSVTMLLFGAAALAGAAGLLRGGASLRLDDEGFEIVGVLNRSRFLWKDIDSIRMAKIRGASVIALDYKSGDPRRSQVSRSLTGMDATIGGNIYEVSLNEICPIMQEWHERYRNAS